MDQLLPWIQSMVQSRIKGFGWEEEDDFVEEGERDVVEDVLEEPGVCDPDPSKLSCMMWSDSMETKSFSLRALREMLVDGPLKEFNRPEFFMAIQLAILFYYPTIALGIMYQQQTETQDTEQIEQMQQMMQSTDTQLTMTQSTIEQIVRMIQSMFTRTQPLTQKTSVRKMTTTKQAEVTNTKMDTMMMRGDGERVRVEVVIKVGEQETFGEGRQEEKKTTVWSTVYITF